jgi:hypothetical protein
MFIGIRCLAISVYAQSMVTTDGMTNEPERIWKEVVMA